MMENVDYKQTDILVIGGGSAGCWAAIRARHFTEDVTLIDKAWVAKSGATVFTHAMLAATPEDERLAWKREFVEHRGEYLNDQDWVDILLTEQAERAADLMNWGAPFKRKSDGTLDIFYGFGHKASRVMLCDGHKLMELMREKVLEAGVHLVERVMVTDLLTSDGRLPTGGRVVGVSGFNTRTGEPIVYRAKAVILATGQMGLKMRSHFTNNLTGDGAAMAYRAGAEMRCLEFCTNGGLAYIEKRYHVGAPSLTVGLGAKFVNALGERFMEKYDPELKERSRLSILCQAFVKEALEGRGPLYYDWSALSAEDLKKIREVRPHTLRPFDDEKIDPRARPMECEPTIWISSGNGDGGISVDIHCQSTIPGLYAVGATTRNPVHGTYSVSGVNLAYNNVSGFRAGEHAGKWSRGEETVNPSHDQVTGLLDAVYSPQARRDGLSPDEIFQKLQRVIVPAEFSVFKSEARINRVLAEIRRIEEEDLPRVSAADVHQLVKANEARNTVLLSKLVFTAALHREESRYWHYREEYPYRDDINWLKWIIVRRSGDDAIDVSLRPVPFERYEIKPETRVRIPHPVQFQSATPKGK